jgi:voltage-gated potassium channel Kch
MAATYGARHSLGIHFALVTIIAAPLVVGSVIHLFPHIFLNIVVLIPALMWSMYLLYKGLPIVLRISPERGMLMASALIGYLLVAAVSFLGITVALWGRGIGPSIGV